MALKRSGVRISYAPLDFSILCSFGRNVAERISSVRSVNLPQHKTRHSLPRLSRLRLRSFPFLFPNQLKRSSSGEDCCLRAAGRSEQVQRIYRRKGGCDVIHARRRRGLPRRRSAHRGSRMPTCLNGHNATGAVTPPRHAMAGQDVNRAAGLGSRRKNDRELEHRSCCRQSIRDPRLPGIRRNGHRI